MKNLALSMLLLALATPAPGQLATPNPAGLAYGHVHLNVSDMELHKRIWVEHFGFSRSTFDGGSQDRAPMDARTSESQYAANSAKFAARAVAGTGFGQMGHQRGTPDRRFGRTP